MKSIIFKRIMIFGRPGSGKTTIAKALYQAKPQYKLIHMDKLMWQSGWHLRPHEGFLSDLNKDTDHPSWIVEGASLRGVSSIYGKCDIQMA
jgi:adenylate kinase family enzyme